VGPAPGHPLPNRALDPARVCEGTLVPGCEPSITGAGAPTGVFAHRDNETGLALWAPAILNPGVVSRGPSELDQAGAVRAGDPPTPPTRTGAPRKGRGDRFGGAVPLCVAGGEEEVAGDVVGVDGTEGQDHRRGIGGEAGGLGQPGDLLVLNMGRPMRIMDLAQDLIALSGADPERIAITFTGMRPGEKMVESLFEPEAIVTSVTSDLMRVSEPVDLEPSLLESYLHDIETLQQDEESRAVALLGDLVPGFTRTAADSIPTSVRVDY